MIGHRKFKGVKCNPGIDPPHLNLSDTLSFAGLLQRSLPALVRVSIPCTHGRGTHAVSSFPRSWMAGYDFASAPRLLLVEGAAAMRTSQP